MIPQASSSIRFPMLDLLYNFKWTLSQGAKEGESSMEEMNIGEIARLTGMQTSAIRYYESIGLVPSPRRSSGWRRYTADVLKRLGVIRTARELGFTLEEIGVLLDGFPPGTRPSERWTELAERKLPEVEDIIHRAAILKSMLEAGIQCDCDCVEDCITSLGESCLASVTGQVSLSDVSQTCDCS
jgi:MerR family redox-sensitive transcriptional activator SoxR